MDIHEHQAKDILATFGVPVPKGGVAFSPEQAAFRCRELGGGRCVVKAQVHSGGRGEAGGVKLCESDSEVRTFASELLGKTLVTKQTDANGKRVDRLWIEEASEIARELYLGFVLDRKSERIMIVASGNGGMEIEDLAEEDPDSRSFSLSTILYAFEKSISSYDIFLNFESNVLTKSPVKFF